jgi:hypothetical protein
MSLRVETEGACLASMERHGAGICQINQLPREFPVSRQEPRHEPGREALRVRGLIEAAVGDVFGVPRDRLGTPSRGKAPVALARQTAMYLAHVSCGLTLTDVGRVFARDRTTVAHACAVIEDRRDDPPFDRALELLEWVVPTLVRHRAAPLYSET